VQHSKELFDVEFDWKTRQSQLEKIFEDRKNEIQEQHQKESDFNKKRMKDRKDIFNMSTASRFSNEE